VRFRNEMARFQLLLHTIVQNKSYVEETGRSYTWLTYENGQNTVN